MHVEVTLSGTTMPLSIEQNRTQKVEWNLLMRRYSHNIWQWRVYDVIQIFNSLTALCILQSQAIYGADVLIIL